MPDRRSYPVTIAGFLVSALIFGGTAAAVVWFASLVVLPWLLAPLSLAGVTRLVAIVVGAAVGVKVALEATRVWLHGWEELLRGTPARRRLRHAILLLPGVAVGVLAVLVVGGGLTDPAAREEPWILVLVGAVGVSVSWVLARTVLAYREGRRQATADRPSARRKG